MPSEDKREAGFGISPSVTLGTEFEQTVQRIAAAYRAAVETPLGATDSMWLSGPLFESKRDVHERLMSDVRKHALELFSRPIETDLLFGFEDNCRSQAARPEGLSARSLVQGGREQLRLLAEAVGVIRIPLPDTTAELDVTTLLEMLDASFGFHIDFPNPWSGEAGLDTGRGILTYRATQALYQAWRLHHLTHETAEPRIVEIGAGSGRTAFYAWRFGLRNYTIVDLPLTAAASAFFLSQTIGSNNVLLYGEDHEDSKPGVRIVPPHAFFQSSDQFDVALNVDSITEMALSTAQAFFLAIDVRASRFLSINHEWNSFRAYDLFADRPRSRAPYLMRAGYVEEVVETSCSSIRRAEKVSASGALIARLEQNARSDEARIIDLEQMVRRLSSGRGALASLARAIARRTLG